MTRPQLPSKAFSENVKPSASWMNKVVDNLDALWKHFKGDNKTITISSTGTITCLVKSPPGGGSEATPYRGDFWVEDYIEKGQNGPANKIKVHWGATDIGYFDDTILDKKIPNDDALPDAWKVIVIRGSWTPDGGYSLRACYEEDYSTNAIPEGEWIIARIKPGGVIEQVWQDGPIYFSMRYFTW